MAHAIETLYLNNTLFHDRLKVLKYTATVLAKVIFSDLQD